jgi:hypothetical protein
MSESENSVCSWTFSRSFQGSGPRRSTEAMKKLWTVS